jgi:hypothetical protein
MPATCFIRTTLPPADQQVRDTLTRQKVVTRERRYRHASGHYLPVQATISFMPDFDLHQVIFQDISERSAWNRPFRSGFSL